MSNVYIKTKIRSGQYAMEYLQKIRKKNILIICDKFMVNSGSIYYITGNLNESNNVTIFDEAIPDPTIEVVGMGLNEACRVRPDIIIGFGGGSAIDTAKGVIYFAMCKKLFPKPKFITIPTTSGTGSEVTSATVITDSESKSKNLISDDEILADTAILDPHLTLSVPRTITANTGMDVMTHAIEAYVATGANVFSDALSEKSVDLLLSSLLACYQDGKNLEVRTKMQEASTLAGMSFNTAGLGANHSMAHQLGGMFHIPHGLANAILLNHVIEFNAVNHDVMKKYAALAYKTQIVSITEAPRMALAALKEVISTLMRNMNMPQSISELEIEKEEYISKIPIMVDNALLDNCLTTTPREIKAAQLQKIFMEIY